MLPWTHPSPHPKGHLDRFSRFCTAHGRESLYFTAPFCLSKLPHRMGRSGTPVLWAHKIPQQPKRHLNRFSRFCRAHDRDKQTDRQTTYSVGNSRPQYVRSTAMRPNNMYHTAVLPHNGPPAFIFSTSNPVPAVSHGSCGTVGGSCFQRTAESHGPDQLRAS